MKVEGICIYRVLHCHYLVVIIAHLVTIIPKDEGEISHSLQSVTNLIVKCVVT